MSLLNKRSAARALALITTALLMISTPATAQQQNQTCYFPDGSESGHLACSSSGTQAACCGDSQVCMDNGLCFGDGIMSRGSCTDQGWNSKECSQYCGEVSTNASIPVMACTNDGEESQFMCGMNTANCKKNSTLFTLPTAGITLRASELEALVNPAVSSALASAEATSSTSSSQAATATTTLTITALPTSNSDSNNAIYTPGQMAGLGVGLSIPLFIATCIAFLLWRKDRARTPKLMYPLPDDLADPYTSKDGKPLHPGIVTAAAGAVGRPPVSRDGSILSFNTLGGGGDSRLGGGGGGATTTPAHMQTFAERYQVMKGASGGFQIQRVELDASPAGGGSDYEGDHELHDLKVPLPKEF